MTNTSIASEDSRLIRSSDARAMAIEGGGAGADRWSAPCYWLDDAPAAAEQIDQEQNRGNHEQRVDDATRHVEREAEYPEQQQQDNKRPEHVVDPPAYGRGKLCTRWP